MNTEIRKNAKNDFEKDFSKSVINAVSENNMENVRKYRDIKFATTKERRIYLVSQPNHYTKKIFR